MKHRIVTAAQMKEIERAGDAHGLHNYSPNPFSTLYFPCHYVLSISTIINIPLIH